MASITLLDLHQYHLVDRALFARLVKSLSRDPAESFLAMAFWFWLEDKRYPSLITGLLRASDTVLNNVADEAIMCLNSLAPDQPMPSVTSTTFTTTIMENNVPLELMHRDKSSTINGIKYFINNVCARIFTDILHQVILGNAGNIPYFQRLSFPGFPHPIFGDVTILKLPLYELFPVDDLWGWNIRV